MRYIPQRYKDGIERETRRYINRYEVAALNSQAPVRYEKRMRKQVRVRWAYRYARDLYTGKLPDLVAEVRESANAVLYAKEVSVFATYGRYFKHFIDVFTGVRPIRAVLYESRDRKAAFYDTCYSIAWYVRQQERFNLYDPLKAFCIEFTLL